MNEMSVLSLQCKYKNKLRCLKKKDQEKKKKLLCEASERELKVLTAGLDKAMQNAIFTMHRASGLTKTEAARMLGISRNTLAKYEYGQYGMSSVLGHVIVLRYLLYLKENNIVIPDKDKIIINKEQLPAKLYENIYMVSV